jgi:hypothetical protein
MLDPKEEKRFEELRGICRELKVPAPPEIHIRLQVHEGGILTFDDVQRGHSWTRNFYVWLFCAASDAGNSVSETLFGAGKLSIKHVTNAIVGTANYTMNRANPAILGNGIFNNTTTDNYGIIVGTGDTAFSTEQYVLATPIATGNAASQLAYNAMIAPVLSYAAKTFTLTFSRIYNNNSGGSITVKEIGLYTGVYCFNAANKWMAERSVLSPTVAVANGAQLTVTYEISMDFSAID